jgi:thioredoxin reductase (NADPH)
MKVKLDCLIIGGGPAGLMAAIYAARFRRKVRVIDAGQSRASLIPRSHNLGGFTHGLSGSELIARMSRQLADLQVSIVKAEVTTLSRTTEGFCAAWDDGEACAPVAVLACGIVDIHPPFDNWREAVEDGLLRYCPICDAFEAKGKRIAVMGPFQHAAGKAIFLRGYSKEVTLLATDEDTDAATRDRLFEAGVTVLTARTPQLRRVRDRVEVTVEGGESAAFEVLYPAMGAKVRSQLAVSLGAEHNEAGFLKVDERQRTSIPGLYGVGDVVTDLHQIAVAFGHGALAACNIHNSLPPAFA